MTTELQMSRTLAFPTERVWRALTDPAALAAWFWPERYRTVVEADLRVGGRFRIDGAGVGVAVAGEYVAVEPPRRLVFTWRWDGDDEETLVTIELTPADADGDAGTVLALRHERFAADTDRDNHDKGWSDCLDRLPGWLASR